MKDIPEINNKRIAKVTFEIACAVKLELPLIKQQTLEGVLLIVNSTVAVVHALMNETNSLDYVPKLIEFIDEFTIGEIEGKNISKSFPSVDNELMDETVGQILSTIEHINEYQDGIDDNALLYLGYALTLLSAASNLSSAKEEIIGLIKLYPSKEYEFINNLNNTNH